MQKSSVGFAYQINDLILVILRSSQTSDFFIIRKKRTVGGNRKGWRRVSVNSIHPLLPFPKKRKHSNEKILFKRAFPDRLALNQSLPKSKKKVKQKNPSPEQWSLNLGTSAMNVVGLGSSACFFRNYSSKERKNFKKLWKFCFFVLQLHSGEQFKQKITIKFTRSRDYRGAFCTNVFVVYTIMISPSTMVAPVYV